MHLQALEKLMTLEQAKEYLHFVDNVVGRLIFERQCCFDFHNALIAQKAKNNLFISWVLGNYHKNLIMNLCKILEQRKNDKHRCTFRFFVQFCKDNYQLLDETMRKATITLTDITTGEIIEQSIGSEMLAALHNIDFDADLAKIDEMHKKVKRYRDKRLAHNHKLTKKIPFPPIDELHEFIDTIEQMMITYHHLFREGIDNSGLKHPNQYGNFVLHLD